jgi:hypothetical protein
MPVYQCEGLEVEIGLGRVFSAPGLPAGKGRTQSVHICLRAV